MALAYPDPGAEIALHAPAFVGGLTEFTSERARHGEAVDDIATECDLAAAAHLPAKLGLDREAGSARDQFVSIGVVATLALGNGWAANPVES